MQRIIIINYEQCYFAGPVVTDIMECSGIIIFVSIKEVVVILRMGPLVTHSRIPYKPLLVDSGSHTLYYVIRSRGSLELHLLIKLSPIAI